MGNRHRRAKELYLRAREVPTEARAAWLEQSCGTDATLRGDVESLLRAEQEMPRDYLEPGAGLSLSAGAEVSHYRLVRHLGTGGMGEVWLAHDERLDRRVALKFPTADRVRDPFVRDRFLHKARAAGALEHPAVCRVFELGELNGRTFIAMEHVEGETLAARLSRLPVPLAQALAWGASIAAALEEAHGKGIVHRDLKPSNIMVTASRQIKVMDFGLARAMPERAASKASAWTSGLTAAGVAAGTPAYMAPEQLRGDPVDGRADIWALGCVLYELLTGVQAFRDPTPSGLETAILHAEPAPLSSHQRLASRSLERVLRKCLAKDVTLRWQSAHDLRDELLWVAETHAEDASQAGAGSASPRRVRQATWTSIPPPDGVTGLGVPALSPDGRSLVFEGWSASGPGHLWLRPLGGNDARRLTGTESATFPFFSPDGRSLGFFADGFLKTVDLAS